MNRRALLQGFAASAAGLLLPLSIAENAETARRYWSLDQTMLPSQSGYVETGWFYGAMPMPSFGYTVMDAYGVTANIKTAHDDYRVGQRICVIDAAGWHVYWVLARGSDA